MLRKECAANEGSHEEISEIGSKSSQHAPGLASGSPQLTVIPREGGASGGTPESGNASSSSTATLIHGENRSDDEPELDPHICKLWPCPQCHKPRDADDEMTPEGQYSAEAALRPTATTQSFFHRHEPLKLKQSASDDDLLLDIVSTCAEHGQNDKGHCS